MIGRLRGIILDKQPPEILVDVTGVAYEVLASMSTFYRLPEPGHEVTLYTHFVVREDAQQLYGFIDLNERSLFRNLIKVNGVGPRMALTILSSIEPDDFVQCVIDNDSLSLVKLPGVGKKTAERLIIEMRDRLADWYTDKFQVNLTSDKAVKNTTKSASQDATSALIALGYKPQEASRVIAQLDTDNLTSTELIRHALKKLASHSH